MGAVQSTLKTLWFAIKALLAMNEELQTVLKRANSSPGLPVPNPSKSYWLEDPPHPELVDKQSPQLPTEADVVIIGSGITAAAVARSFLNECARKSHVAKSRDGDRLSTSSLGSDEKATAQDLPRVVVLEARTLCSGATGRNGGHIKSSPHELFALMLAQKMREERAAALVRFQVAHVDILTSLCEAQGWDVAECRKVETVDLFIDDEDRETFFKKIRDVQKWVPELGIKMWNAEEAQKRFEANGYVRGAMSYTAGALWPFRLVSCVWKDLLAEFENYLSLETDTPVTSIETSKTQSQHGYAYEVTTTRGTIRCNHVVHATNGFTTQFVPGLKNKMTGFLGQMSAQRPGGSFSDRNGDRSWSVVYGKSFDYATQRPTVNGKPGDIMLGGGSSRAQNDGFSAVGIWDDSKMDALSISHISGIFPTVFEPRWGDEAEGGRIKTTWSGIVCVTGDLRPFVGFLDPKLTGRKPGISKEIRGVQPGEWVSAGYCGDGMVWAWLSGTALGLMLAGSEAENVPKEPGTPGGRLADWFPSELKPTLQRVKKANLENLAEIFF
ncbi:FAD dependent oxidoreductase [Xylariaceae sp. FL1651]|nr:FAD dependent oxidoreductase [Xylariaceae sp. FL1651]